MICAKCKHGWQAESPPDEASVSIATAVTEPVPATATSAASKISALENTQPFLSPRVKSIIKKVLMGAGGLFLAWFVLDRYEIARNLAFLEPFYDIIGLHIYHTGEGLTIQSVRSELVYEDGIMKLTVEGKIMNTTKKTLEIPPLRASAIASDGHVMQDWQIDAPAAKVDPGKDMPFRSSINAPKGTVADINLNFIEINPDATQ